MWVKYIWLEHIVGFTVQTVLGHIRGHITSGWLSLSNTVIDPRIWDISACPCFILHLATGKQSVICCFNTLQVSAPQQSLSKQLLRNRSTLSAEIFSLVSKWLFSSLYDSFYIYLLAFWQSLSSQLGLFACPEIQFLLERKDKKLSSFCLITNFQGLFIIIIIKVGFIFLPCISYGSSFPSENVFMAFLQSSIDPFSLT